MQRFTTTTAKDGYRVPQRFSIAEILAMMTVFAFLFGTLRCFRAPATLYMFLGTQAVVICLVQMRFGNVPRGASMIVGCVFLPVWAWVSAAFGAPDVPSSFEGTPVDALLAIVFGGLLGYCTGALAAGVFLVMDMVHTFAHRSASRRAGTS